MSAATNKTIVAVVLAAGLSSRFGATKQLTDFDGDSLAGRVVRVAAGSKVKATAIVVGHDWQAVCSAITPCDAFFVRNENFADGIGSSLALAARATEHVADAIIVLLADQPLITSGHLDALINTWSGAADEIVATSFAGTVGPPVLFAGDCFDELKKLDGDSGARSLLQDSRFAVTTVDFPDAAIDIDVPADLSLLRRNARS